MKRIIVTVAAVLAAVGLSAPAALASGENGTPAQICAEGQEWPIPDGLPEDALQAMFERGTVWLFEKEGVTGTGISLFGPPPPLPGITNVREVSFTVGACGPAAPGKPAPFVPIPARGLYCAAAGNTHPFTGAAIAPGTALNLLVGQPNTDPHYKGATPANFVDGVDSNGRYIGLTCDPPPAGFVRSGTAGDAQHVSEEPGYPLWVKG